MDSRTIQMDGESLHVHEGESRLVKLPGQDGSNFVGFRIEIHTDNGVEEK